MSICMKDIWMQTSHEGRAHTMEDWETCHNPSWSSVRREPGQPSLSAEPSVLTVLLRSTLLNSASPYRVLLELLKGISLFAHKRHKHHKPGRIPCGTLRWKFTLCSISYLELCPVTLSKVTHRLYEMNTETVSTLKCPKFEQYETYFFYYSTSPQTKSPCK